jgi:DNA processing protein
MSREPVNDDELRASIQLSMVEGIGPRRFAELVSWCGSACQVLELSHAQLKELSPVKQQQLTSLHSPANQARAGEILEHCQGSGTRILLSHFDDYPALLREIHDPPPLLYVRGDRLSRDDLSLAIVGTRFASPYGLEMARRLSTAAAQAGFTVVSGLARGIDGVAHEAALLAGGRTIAVLGSGVDRIYPAEHRSLADQVTNAGMLISEFPPLARPTAAAFPRRNRVISGISLGVIVVEAPQRSGALITARLALEQGREVFAVPGPVDQASSRGCHQLLRDGAVLVECLDQVIEELGPLAQSATDREGHRVFHPAELDLNELERTVLDAIGNRPTSIDQLIRSSELSTPQVLATLSTLEVRLLISRQAGQMVIRR